MAVARRLCQKLNAMDRSDFEGLKAVARELLGSSENAVLNPPFYCDYGFHIHVGKNFFANYNCTILDVGCVTIGSNCVIGAGSVVTRDIPDWTLAAGNPCRVLRKITEEDRRYYFKDREFDGEAMCAVFK